MGDPIPIDFGLQSDPGRYGADTGPRHINAYAEQVIQGQPSLPIYAAAGLDLFSTVPGGGSCRGMIVLDEVIIAVTGTQLVKIDASGTATVLGGIPGTSKVVMARNEKANTPQVAIVVDGLAFILENNILTQINDPDLPPPSSVTYLDQRFIFGIPDGRFFYSEIDDGGNIGALNFEAAEGAPDGLVRVFTHLLDLWLFGENTTEMWRSTTDPNNPFQRAGGGFFNRGCSAPHSVDHIGNYVFWVGDDNVVYGTSQYVPIPISHAKISRDLKAITDRESIIGFTYVDGGASFYCLTSPLWTWTYNLTTSLATQGPIWFERQSYNLPNWRCQFAVNFSGSTVVGGNTGGLFYTLNQNTFTENGDYHVWTLRTSPVHAYPNRIAVDRLHLDLIPGAGINSTNPHSQNPQVGLRWSDDGGKSFSRQLTRQMGAQGHNMTRMVFNGLGTTGREGRIWEIQVSAPVARGLRQCSIEGDEIGT